MALVNFTLFSVQQHYPVEQGISFGNCFAGKIATSKNVWNIKFANKFLRRLSLYTKHILKLKHLMTNICVAENKTCAGKLSPPKK
jgi:hypothetical protein